jgi:HEAT repeat protein
MTTYRHSFLLRTRLALGLGLAFGLVLGAGCGGGQANASDLAEREVRDLITALTPPPPTSIPVVKSDFYMNRKKTLERLRGASEAHGLVALRLYRDEPPTLPEVRCGLLDIAAHTAPEASVAVLVQLVTTFGEDLFVRREAAELLGECIPERAIEVLEPILRERYDDRTYPPEERMLDAWTTACERLKRDPVPLLVLVATDLQRPQEVRHLATKALGRHPSPMGRQALEALLVESSGNGYIRRLALQSLRASIPKGDFCAVAKQTQEREADPEFIAVLQDAMDENCR